MSDSRALLPIPASRHDAPDDRYEHGVGVLDTGVYTLRKGINYMELYVKGGVSRVQRVRSRHESVRSCRIVTRGGHWTPPLILEDNVQGVDDPRTVRSGSIRSQ